MIDFLLSFYVEVPVFAGIVTGAVMFGIPTYAIAWCVGYEAAMRKVGGWMHQKRAEVHGDMPTLPPIRDRRFISTTPGRWS